MNRLCPPLLQLIHHPSWARPPRVEDVRGNLPPSLVAPLPPSAGKALTMAE